MHLCNLLTNFSQSKQTIQHSLLEEARMQKWPHQPRIQYFLPAQREPLQHLMAVLLVPQQIMHESYPCGKQRKSRLHSSIFSKNIFLLLGKFKLTFVKSRKCIWNSLSNLVMGTHLNFVLNDLRALKKAKHWVL